MNFSNIISRKYKAILFSWIDCFFSKKDNKVIIVVKNRTEYAGNLRVATDILLDEKKYKIFIYKDGQMVPDIKKTLKDKGIIILEGWSIISLYHLLTSGVFIFSHSPRDAHITKKCKKRVIINLWHGVAFKRIENLMPNIKKKKQKQIQTNADICDLLIASSEIDRETNIQAFVMDKKKVKVVGLPRYDILKEKYVLDSFLKEQKNKLLAYKQDKKLILYAPTFRENNISALDKMSKLDWDMLSEMLSNTNSIMAIRSHAYDKYVPKYIQGNKNFFLLPHLEYTETNLVLQYTDILLVDFSSIWIDFLLLNRPIIGFAKDFDDYLENERGFIYDFESTFPDVFFHSTKILCEYLETSLIKGTSNIIYTEALKKFHKYELKTNFSEKLKKEICE